MRLIDLFCGAGGAATGYYRAGFTEIVGVDIHPQPRYPFAFIQADAMTYPLDDGDAFHASPPCQRYSAGAAKWKTSDEHPDLIAATRDRLLATGKPYVIENIMPARPLLWHPVMLCGTMFGLGVFRHRLFESNVSIPRREHRPHDGKIGDGRFMTVTGHAGGSSKRDGWKGGSVDDWRRAMGIDWMVGDELAESIPPAYTEFIGRFLLGGLQLIG